MLSPLEFCGAKNRPTKYGETSNKANLSSSPCEMDPTYLVSGEQIHEVVSSGAGSRMASLLRIHNIQDLHGFLDFLKTKIAGLQAENGEVLVVVDFTSCRFSRSPVLGSNTLPLSQKRLMQVILKVQVNLYCFMRKYRKAV